MSMNLDRYILAHKAAEMMAGFYDDIKAQLAAGTVEDDAMAETYRRMIDNAPNMYFALGCAAAHEPGTRV
jgi:hypothetical protein